ncbi:Dihydrolipoamide dehydrogenase [Sulfitobacter noctilucicola]|uniref:SAM-dependent methyltransferase n=1 Tax=Sulfitobacter noctilucicola TaxID=1342301 RepID=A0A7W6MBJ3_9RHOB|nr:methyltransferase [Sulfitobacter noctilucicola]KIN63294.1 Dihydrolipoamide dehydrogenase [Sulfitobacter noctilucicola]MBB4175187.1 SAM-dependent methyltransferase [Sulfitobacter noctilucicola]
MMYNRVVQEKRARKMLGRIVTPETEVGEISGKMAKQLRLKPKSFERFDFPEFDVCGEPFQDEGGAVRQFDVMIANQVWEHLDRPYKATQNIHAMLREGGYFYVAVPFYVRYHGYPVDCSRWSARGLKNLLIEGGFDEDKIEAEQWGNLECAQAECGYRFARYDEEKHSIKNDPQFPVVSWAIAQK